MRHVDWRVGDPAGAPLDEVRRVCHDIDRRVHALAEDLLEDGGASRDAESAPPTPVG